MSQKQQMIQEQAPTIEEAVDAGLTKLGLSKEWVDVEVIDEGRRGLLGIGGRDAVVRLHVRSSRIDQGSQQPVNEAGILVEPSGRTISEEYRPEPSEDIGDHIPDSLEREDAVPSTLTDKTDESAAATEVVESLLEKMGISASVETAYSPPDDLTGRQVLVLNISGDDLGLLIGPRGETLDAIQHLARLMVGHQIRQRANFVIDVEGYRERRQQALARLAERMGKKAIDRGRPVTLEPMPPHERRIIHMTLRENPQLRTESTGEGDRRRVRIYPV